MQFTKPIRLHIIWGLVALSMLVSAQQGALRMENTVSPNRDAYAFVNDNSQLRLQQFTIECWFKPLGVGVGMTTDSNGATLVGKTIEGGSGTYVFSYILQWSPNTSKVNAYLAHATSSGTGVVSTSSVAVGQVAHAAFTFDGSFLRLYVNGNLEATQPWSLGTVYYGNNRTLIGAGNYASPYFRRFDGVTDDVLIWNHARSAAQIVTDRTCGTLWSTAGLVAQWTFDGSSYADRTGHGLNLTPVASCSFVSPLATYSGPSHSQAGHMSLDSFMGDPTGLTASIEIEYAGSTIGSGTTHLDGASNYQFTSNLCGTYSLLFKPSHWLKRRVSNVNLSQDNVGLDLNLINGDVVSDNEVNLADYGALTAAFQSTVGDSNWNAAADLNGDDEVNLADYSILARNFGQVGDD